MFGDQHSRPTVIKAISRPLRCPTTKFSNYINYQNQEYTKMMTPKRKLIFDDKEPMEVETNVKEQLEVENTQNFQDFVPWKDVVIDFKNLHHVKINRARLLDWLVEVCIVYKQTWQTLWTTISLLDKMTIEKGKVKVSNIHLYGTTSLFIASSYNQPVNCLTLKTILDNITHGKFTFKQVLDCKEQIFQQICLAKNGSMHFPTMEDRVLDCFPRMNQWMVKKVLIELFYFWQQPSMVENVNTDLTEKRLVRKVGQAILMGERYKNCGDVEQFFLTEYGCCNIKKFGEELAL